MFSAKFICDGQKAILTGNRKHYYIYDIATNKLDKQTIGNLDQKNLSNVVVSKELGSDLMVVCSPETGNAHIFSQKTRKLISSLKMNGSCNSVCFSPGDKYLFSAGDQGDIY